MGRLLQNRTPAQLAWIIAASNLLVASSFATIFLESYYHPKGHPHLWAGLAPFALLILGGVMGMFAEVALKDGIASEKWPEALVASTRKIFTHPAIHAAIGMLLTASIAVVVISAFSSGRHATGAWIFLFPAMSLTRVRAIFTRPHKNSSGLGIQDAPRPLRSDHWGASPQRFSR